MSLFANGIEGIPAAPQAATRACHICGSTEHLKKDCPQAGGGGRSNKLCHICGKPGHLKKDCPDAGNALADGVADLSVAPKAARKKRVMCYNCGQVCLRGQPVQPDHRSINTLARTARAA